MLKSPLVFLLLFVVLVLFSSAQISAQDKKKHTDYFHTETETTKEKKIDFTLRFGQGGFRDSRSPEGGLGGGQLALDIKLVRLPVALSISSEYYTNSPDPIHSYEISDMVSINLLYIDQLLNIERADYFFGGGFGRLKVPQGEGPASRVKGDLYNLEAGIHVRAFWRIGFYGAAKYLSAQKKVNNIKVIDFNEGIILLGVTFNFSL